MKQLCWGTLVPKATIVGKNSEEINVEVWLVKDKTWRTHLWVEQVFSDIFAFFAAFSEDQIADFLQNIYASELIDSFSNIDLKNLILYRDQIIRKSARDSIDEIGRQLVPSLVTLDEFDGRLCDRRKADCKIIWSSLISDTKSIWKHEPERGVLYFCIFTILRNFGEVVLTVYVRRSKMMRNHRLKEYRNCCGLNFSKRM